MVENLRYVRLRPLQRKLIWLLVLLALFLVLTIVVLRHLKPLLTSLATARVSNTVNRIVVAAVDDAVASGEINYDALVRFEKDDSGRVTALRSNMAEANRLQTEISDDILQRLSEVSTSELRIPIGTLTGAAILAGRGPALCVRMQTVGSSSAAFRNEFSAAGINQTKHQILLDVDVNMSILLPGFSAYTTVSNVISVAETVIVGSVPQTYTYFSAGSDVIDNAAQEYIMNNG